MIHECLACAASKMDVESVNCERCVRCFFFLSFCFSSVRCLIPCYLLSLACRDNPSIMDYIKLKHDVGDLEKHHSDWHRKLELVQVRIFLF